MILSKSKVGLPPDKWMLNYLVFLVAEDRPIDGHMIQTRPIITLWDILPSHNHSFLTTTVRLKGTGKINCTQFSPGPDIKRGSQWRWLLPHKRETKARDRILTIWRAQCSLGAQPTNFFPFLDKENMCLSILSCSLGPHTDYSWNDENTRMITLPPHCSFPQGIVPNLHSK